MYGQGVGGFVQYKIKLIVEGVVGEAIDASIYSS